MHEGLKQAIGLANRSRRNVNAYRHFLRSHNYKAAAVSSRLNFERLPVTDKKNYIHGFQLFDLFPANSLPNMAYASSGSSGQPTFWFRDDEADAAGGMLHEKIFREIFKLKKEDSTLVIICFSMGVWVAGSYTFSACRWISRQGYRLTTITPGIEKHDIFNILKTLAPKFKNVIVAGYPSFIMDILSEADRKKIPLPPNMKIITAGDAFTEKWREAALKHMGHSANADSIINIYGSADAGSIGFETPMTIFLRKTAEKNQNLYHQLFGNPTITPTIYQFLPEQIYIESPKDELLLTTKNTIPLIRYNIHDIGTVWEWQSVIKLLEHSGLLKPNQRKEFAKWQLPFIIKHGRTDVGLTYYSLNVYPENLRFSIEATAGHKDLSGNFAAYSNNNKSHNKEKFHINLELSQKGRLKTKDLPKLSKEIAKNLGQINPEFRKLHSVLGSQALPAIHLFKQGDPNLTKIHSGFAWMKNKKPKIVI